MKRLAPFDPLMLGCVLLLLAMSIIMVASASLGIAEVRYHDPLRIISHWLVYIPLGLVIMWRMSRIDTTWWQAGTMPLLVAGLLLLTLVLVPAIGTEMNGARRWFSLFGLTLQPIELFKPVLILYMAHYMATYPDRLACFSTGLAPMLVVLGVTIGLLLLQPDFGNSALLAMVCLGMWFVGGIPIKQLMALVGGMLPVGAIILIAEPYRLRRLLSFIDPWADPLGSGYQLVQSMLAFGAGGIQGTGLGQGVQKLFYLPEPFTDFIAAVLAEELGLIGTLALIATFSALLWRGFLLATGTSDTFSRLLITGCMLLLGTTFLINMGAAMGILPTKGMPMPLMSYGGSALLGNCALLGLVFSVQRHQPQNSRKGRCT